MRIPFHRTVRHGILFMGVFIFVVGIFVASKEIPLLSQGNGADAVPPRPIIVAATSFPFLRDIIAHVGKGYVTIQTVNGSQTVSHGMAGGATMPKNMKAFFALNATADGWAENFFKNIQSVSVYMVSDYITLRADAITQMLATNDSSSSLASSTLTQEQGGYFWLSPRGGREMASYVARVLGTIDPTHSVFYFNNAYEYEYQLNDLGSTLYDQLQPLRSKKVIVTSPGWDLFLATFDIHPFARMYPYPGADQTFQSSVSAIAQMLTLHPNAVVLGDATFPLSALTALNQKFTSQTIIVDVYGGTIADASYVDFLKRIVAELVQSLP